MPACPSPIHRAHRGGFTLIELLVVIDIIAVLICLAVLPLQGNRTQFNHDQAVGALTQVSRGEAGYFATHGTYTTDVTQFKVQPQQGGYGFQITTTGVGAAAMGYVAVATPAAPGLTGDVTLGTRQVAGGKITETPTPGATAARQEAFDTIHTQVNQTLEPLLVGLAEGKYAGTPQDRLTALQTSLTDPGTPQAVLKKLDANADGSVTLPELLTYDRDTSSPLGGLLASIGKDLQIGAGGEQVNALPGISVTDLAPANLKPGRLDLLAAGRSQVVIPPTGALPAVQLTGYSLGGVRFPDSAVPLIGVPFTVSLTAPDGGAITGPVLIGGPNGPALTGELIGLPAVQRFGTSLQGVVILTGGRGPLQNAFGSGSVQIAWDTRSLNGLFAAGSQTTLTVPASP